jgi:hypothetical protein
MINLELKAKHYYLIADILFGTAAYVSFNILEKIKTACTGVADDDLVTVEIDISNILFVFRILAQKPEGSHNQINSEMIDLLTPQIVTGVGNDDAEWISLGEQITSIRAENLAVVTNAIQSGKSKLYN